MSGLPIRFGLYWKSFCWSDPQQTESWWTRSPYLHFFPHYIPGINHPFLWQALQFASFFDIILTCKYNVARTGTNVASTVLSCSLHFALNFLHGPHCTNVEIISECSVKGSCRQVDKKYCRKSHLSAGASRNQRASREPEDCRISSAEVTGAAHTQNKESSLPFQCNGSAIRQVQQCDGNRIL